MNNTVSMSLKEANEKQIQGAKQKRREATTISQYLSNSVAFKNPSLQNQT